MEYWWKGPFKLQSIMQKFIHIFQLSSLDLTLIPFIQIPSEYCVSVFLPRITCFLSLELFPVAPEVSYKLPAKQTKASSDPELMDRHWAMHVQQCVCSHSTWRCWAEIPKFSPMGCSLKYMVNRKKRSGYKSLEVSLLRWYLMQEPQGKLNSWIDWKPASQKLLNL